MSAKGTDWEDTFSSARAIVSRFFRYFTRLCYSIEVIPPQKATTEKVATYGSACLAIVTDTWKLYLNPTLLSQVVDAYKIDPMVLAVSTWLHEIFHILRRHIQRGEGKLTFLWNIAADCEENDDLVEVLESKIKPSLLKPLLNAKILLTPDMLGLPSGLSAEEYYAMLSKGVDTLKEMLQQQMQHIMMSGGEGGGGSGGEEVVEKQCFQFDSIVTEDSMMGIEKDERGSIDPILQESIINATAQEILNHAKSIGNVPAGLVRWAESVGKNRVDWREILRRRIRRGVEVFNSKVGDFTYFYPHKLSRWREKPPIIFPSQVAPRVPIAIIVDTSGSMSDAELGIALREIKGIVRSGGYLTYLISCDADVHKVEKIWGDKLHHEKVALVGGGGTNMVEGLKWVQKNIRPLPVVVIITDGYTPWNGVEDLDLQMPVICCLVGKNRASKESVPSKFLVVEVE